MASDLHLSGPTVTLFGERDALDRAVCDELEARGCSTHVVTTAVGWLSSTTHAVIRTRTDSGDRALEDLAGSDTPATHLVVVAEATGDETLDLLPQPAWQQVTRHHMSTVVRHDPSDPDGPATEQLASTIADHVLENIELGSGT